MRNPSSRKRTYSSTVTLRVMGRRYGGGTARSMVLVAVVLSENDHIVAEQGQRGTGHLSAWRPSRSPPPARRSARAGARRVDDGDHRWANPADAAQRLGRPASAGPHRDVRLRHR